MAIPRGLLLPEYVSPHAYKCPEASLCTGPRVRKGHLPANLSLLPQRGCPPALWHCQLGLGWRWDQECARTVPP
jgi:hypothetical protein